VRGVGDGDLVESGVGVEKIGEGLVESVRYDELVRNAANGMGCAGYLGAVGVGVGRRSCG
jgi:hypothetical protein